MDNMQFLRNVRFYHSVKQIPVFPDSSSPFVTLPPELWHALIEYYTNNLAGLFQLRTISKEWKEFAESSPLWKKINLVFYCPKDFLLHYYEKHQYLYLTIEALAARIRTKLQYQELPTRYYRHYQLLQGFTDDLSKGYICVTGDADNNRMETVFTDDSKTVFEESLKIFTWFRNLMEKHQQMWNKQIQRRKLMDVLHRTIEKHFRYRILPIGFAILDVLFCLSIYGFYTIHNNMYHLHTFSWENHLSFVSLELICVVHGVLAAVDALSLASNRYSCDENCHPDVSIIDCFTGGDIVICLFILLLLLSILVHYFLFCKAMGYGHPPWTVLIVPCWLSILLWGGIIYYRLYLSPKKGSLDDGNLGGCLIGTGILFLVAITITFLCLFADSYLVREYYSFGCALIPVMPLVPFIVFAGVRHCYEIIHVLLYPKSTKDPWSIPASKRNSSTIYYKVLNWVAIVFWLLLYVCLVLLCYYAFSPKPPTTTETLPPIFLLFIMGFAGHALINISVVIGFIWM
jgi:hypothetical protein